MCNYCGLICNHAILARRCHILPLPRCTACAYPAAASIASLGFCAVVAALLARVTARMMAGVINRHLHRRLRAFQLTCVGGARPWRTPHHRCCSLEDTHKCPFPCSILVVLMGLCTGA